MEGIFEWVVNNFSVLLPTGVIGLFWWRLNKREKEAQVKLGESEARKAEIGNQADEIDLGVKFATAVSSVFGENFSERFGDFFEKVSELAEEVKDIKINTTTNTITLRKLQLLNLMEHDPTQERYINALYAEYKASNGNSYVDSIYEKWAKSYAERKRARGGI
jgi:hypothetical protein